MKRDTILLIASGLLFIAGAIFPYDYLVNPITNWLCSLPWFQGWKPEQILLFICVLMGLIGYFLMREYNLTRRRKY